MLECDNVNLKKSLSNNLERASIKKLNIFTNSRTRKPSREHVGQACNGDVLSTVRYSLFNVRVSCAGNCFPISVLWEQMSISVQQAAKSLHGRGEPAAQYRAPSLLVLRMDIFTSLPLHRSISVYFYEDPRHLADLQTACLGFVAKMAL